jgi:hypothetical protein
VHLRKGWFLEIGSTRDERIFAWDVDSSRVQLTDEL